DLACEGRKIERGDRKPVELLTVLLLTEVPVPLRAHVVRVSDSDKTGLGTRQHGLCRRPHPPGHTASLVEEHVRLSELRTNTLERRDFLTCGRLAAIREDELTLWAWNPPLQLFVHGTGQAKPSLRRPGLETLDIPECHLLNLRLRRCRNNSQALTGVKHGPDPQNRSRGGIRLRRTVRGLNQRAGLLSKQRSFENTLHLLVRPDAENIRLPSEEVLLIQVLEATILHLPHRARNEPSEVHSASNCSAAIAMFRLKTSKRSSESRSNLSLNSYTEASTVSRTSRTSS